MLKFILIITFSILFAGCVNEVGNASSTILAPGDEETGVNDEETSEDDEETSEDDEGGKKFPGDLEDIIRDERGPLLGGGLVEGCMLEDAPNYNSEANLTCTTNCIDNKTGSNCCCED